MYIAETIKTNVEEAKSVLTAGLKLVVILAPVLAGAVIGLPILTVEEILSVSLVVLGLSLGVVLLRK